MTAINSHVILPIARDCAAQNGDFWVIYMGNNEVVGPYGSGTVFGAQAANLALVRAGCGVQGHAHRTGLGQAWCAICKSGRSTRANGAEWSCLCATTSARRTPAWPPSMPVSSAT